MKKVLLTGGGTSEAIDQVRKITNTSTGRLAKEIFNLLYKDNYSIDMICSHNIEFSEEELSNANIHYISDFASLSTKFNELLTNNDYDLIIHAMAISDYYVSGVYDLDDLVEQIINASYDNKEELKQIIKQTSKLDNTKKISSNYDDLIIDMQQTTKLISLLRTYQPKAIIVGCKLLDNVSENELIKVAQKQIINNQLDFCIANDMKNIYGQTHKALILNKFGNIVSECHNKVEIARRIIELSKEENHG